MEDVVSLAQALIRCESVTPNEGGALALIEKKLASLGFHCHRETFEEAGTEAVENLFARFGNGSPHFCFAGHSDVVPPGDLAQWKHPPFAAVIEDGMLYGRGAEDMKGAIAAFIVAVERYLGEMKNFGGSISLLITADEEGIAVNGTRKMLGWMEANGHLPDMCLVGEPTNPETLGEMVKIGRRGSVNAVITMQGRQGHVAYPHLAENPVTALLGILQSLKARVLDEGTEFFLPSNLEVTTIDVGNPSHNVIPAQAVAKLNIRFNDRHSGASLKEWIEQVCRESGARCHVSVQISGEAFMTPPGPLSALVAEAVRDATGRMPELSTTGGTSDARFIKDYCPVVEFGATGRTPHMVNECVRVSDLEMLGDIYLGILKRVFA